MPSSPASTTRSTDTTAKQMKDEKAGEILTSDEEDMMIKIATPITIIATNICVSASDPA